MADVAQDFDFLPVFSFGISERFTQICIQSRCVHSRIPLFLAAHHHLPGRIPTKQDQGQSGHGH